MGTLFKRSGHLLRTSTGHLAKCPDVEICCNGGLPTGITLVGGTGCYAALNGTFALNSLAPTFPCRANYLESVTLPGNPCTAGTHCYSDMQFISFANRTVYHYLFDWGVTVDLSDIDSGISIGIGGNIAEYYLNSLGNCTLKFPGGGFSHVYTRATCRTGSFSMSGSSWAGSTPPTISGLTWPP